MGWQVLDADFSDDGNETTDIGNYYTYTGRTIDSETGLFEFRTRYYCAQLGAFLSRDVIGYEGSECEGHAMPDHVHICLTIPPKYAVSYLIGFIKGKSDSAGASRAVKRTADDRLAFLGSWILGEHGGP